MSSISQALERLEAFVRHEDFAGWDPFDGLNSRIFQASPLKHSRLARLLLLQVCKRSPLNLRPVLQVPKGQNNKGLGLFLAASVRLHRATGETRYEDDARRFVDLLRAGISPGFSGACWGYNFDWQARAFFQPKGEPTAVATSFVANALLDASEGFDWGGARELAYSACDFIKHDLNRTEFGGDLCFSYSPADRSCVYNASMLAAQLLSRVGALKGDQELMDLASKAVSFALKRQQPDGSWRYGDLPYHDWVDSFHTGFMLDCLQDYHAVTSDLKVKAALDRGFEFFRSRFFRQDGAPKYYADKLYPIDGHTPGQAIITLVRFGEVTLARKVAQWAIANMQASDGHFVYQITPRYTNRIPYMRWVQAWMFRALAELRLLELTEYQGSDSGSGRTISDNLIQGVRH